MEMHEPTNPTTPASETPLSQWPAASHDAGRASSNGDLPLQRVTRLAVLDKPFAAWGLAKVRVTRNGQATDLEIPIRAVDLQDVERAVAPMRPGIPTRRERIEGRWQTIIDEANPDYLQKQAEYQRALSRCWVLMALDVDIVDAQGEIVWSQDNTVCHFDRATQALHDMGLVDMQLAAIFRAVQALVTDEQDEQVRD